MSKKIIVSELEFDQIKQNIKTFLSSQSEFSDYNYEGSVLSVLMDVLAYNTHYNALYDNMLVNESFLDSASKRDSVVSRAQDLGYTPRSAKCSTMNVNLSFSSVTSLTEPPSAIILPAFSPFNANSSSGSYVFYNTQDVVLRLSGSKYVANNVALKAGKPVEFVVTYDTEGTRFIIPNTNCDTETLTISVFDSATHTADATAFTAVDNLMTVDGNSPVYWIKEIENFLYEIKFGDDILGKALNIGNAVKMQYMVSYGQSSNDVRSVVYSGNKSFYYSSSQSITVNTSVTVLGPSFGGSDIETVDSIKFNAPRLYSSQNRAVTSDDYKAIILSQFPDASTVSVWGGEDNDPPEYGKVFICVATNTQSPLSESQILALKSILRNKKMLTVTPEIMDANYIELILDVYVYYNPLATTKKIGDIRSAVIQTITDYNSQLLNTFESVFRYSKLTRLIDNSEIAITNTNMKVKMRRKLEIYLNAYTSYNVNLINPIKKGTLSSNGFYVYKDDYLHFIDDDSTGKVRLYHYGTNGEKIVDIASFGTVNYTKGIISIPGVNIVALQDDDLYLSMECSSMDVVSALTQIISISESDIAVNVIPDDTAKGDLRAGFNYKFT